MWCHTVSFFTIRNLIFILYFSFILYFIIHKTNLSCKYHLQSCKKLNLYWCHSIVACWPLDIRYSKRVIFTLPPFFLIFSWTWKNIYDTLEAWIWDVWMVEPWGSTLVSNLQTLSRPSKGATWSLEVRVYRSTLHKKVGNNTKCPIQNFIEFVLKLFYKFLIIICYFPKILYDSDISLS